MARPRLRVISGTAGGRRLVAPPGTTARPTTDRVKESLFAALGDDRLHDATVLDLYAGSGALAIEALSRGAAGAVLVERERRAAEAIEQNLAATGFADRARMLRADVERVLDRPVPFEGPFDLVFLDPPYDMAPATLNAVLDRLHGGAWLHPGATVVVERGSAAERPTFPAPWAITWERSYGDTLLIVASSGSTQ